MSSLSRFGEVITPGEGVNTLANHILMVTLEQYIMCFREREREREGENVFVWTNSSLEQSW